MAFSSVGIFCLSHIDVFKDDAAQLMFDFLQKSKYWKYENECRFFRAPGIKDLQDVELDLVSVLYTPRFSDKNLSTLSEISTKICKIDIRGIYAAHGKYQFLLKKDGSPIHKWLEKK